jgi:hypothetical protein
VGVASAGACTRVTGVASELCRAAAIEVFPRLLEVHEVHIDNKIMLSSNVLRDLFMAWAILSIIV